MLLPTDERCQTLQTVGSSIQLKRFGSKMFKLRFISFSFFPLFVAAASNLMWPRGAVETNALLGPRVGFVNVFARKWFSVGQLAAARLTEPRSLGHD